LKFPCPFRVARDDFVVMRRRVKITGIGIISPAGIGIIEFERNILRGGSFVSPITRFPEEGGEFVASEVKRFDHRDFSIGAIYSKIPRHTKFALAAAELALRDCSLLGCELSHLGPVVITGTSLMDSEVVSQTISNVTKKGPRFALARVVFQGPVSSVSTAVADAIGGARTLTIQSACCSGLDAIGHGADIVASGESDIAICGGAEAPIFYHPMLELKSAGLSPATSENFKELCRPFDLWRTTGVIGEGACVCVIEPETSPRRGYALVRGYGHSTDSASSTLSGLPHAIGLCLANAEAKACEISAINAWGPGHKEIDVMEADSIYRIFGKIAKTVPVCSIKGAIGNPFAAAGALQVGCAALGLKGSYLPPTVNWSRRDPKCDLSLSRTVRFFSQSNVIINSHGVSGTNACMLLQRCA
jgi:3-oxoacyl-(acyl-carrier-protein) synthase